MTLQNLQEGMVFNNYKSLCAALCVKQVTGKSKQIQLQKLSQYVQFRKEGNKYIIEKLLVSPDTEIVPDSKSPYIKLIETLLVAKLVKAKDSYVEYTYKELIQALNMASENYEKVYYQTSYDYIYNHIAPISREIYDDWRRYAYGENKKKIRSALDSMERRKLIVYEEIQYVCCEAEGGLGSGKVYVHREPEKSEWENYLTISRMLLEAKGCDSIDQLKKKNLYQEYQKDLAEEIREKLGWMYIYKKLRIHHILKDSTRLLEKTRQNLLDAAREKKIEINEKEINRLILNMLNNIGKANHENAINKISAFEIDGLEPEEYYSQLPNSLFKLVFRTKNNYLPGWNILSDYYIAGDEDSAKDKAKEYPTEEDADVEIS